MTAARRRTSTRTWIVRTAVVVALGFGVGAALGVQAVRAVDPGRPGHVDSLDLLLDSLARRPAATAAQAGSPGSAGRAGAGGVRLVRDSVVEPAPADERAVPDVTGRQEGDARRALEAAGFVLGGVEFSASTEPAGTVLRTIPAAGARAARSTEIALVLSDGRPPADAPPPDQP
jgi:hypothetical protein